MSKKKSVMDNSIYSSFMAKGGVRFQENAAADREMIIRNMYRRILIEIATNRFQWVNLPKSVNPRFLELTLTLKGVCVFFLDSSVDKFMALRGHAQGANNIQDEPVELRVTGGSNYPGKTLKAVTLGESVSGEAVPIWSNYLRVPDWDIIEIYSHKLAMIDTTIEINLRNARRTRVVVIDENTRLSQENLMKQIDEGQPFIKVTNPDMVQQLLAVDLGVEPLTIEKLHIIRVRLWNECLGLLGINGANQDKKERLVADEVNANDEQIGVTQAVSLNARRQAADTINRRWPEKLMESGGPISVEIGAIADYGVPAQPATGLEGLLDLGEENA